MTTSLDGQGEWGGNLDIRDVAPGNRIFLPIFHEGALFYLGDVHASQGDTEFTGTAAETKARVRLRLELGHGKRIPGMRIEKPGSLVAIHAEKPLDQAVETATTHLMDWLISRVWLFAGRRVLPGEHLPRLSDQRLPDVPDPEPATSGRGGDSQALLARVICQLRIGPIMSTIVLPLQSAWSAAAVALRKLEGVRPRPAGDALALGARIRRLVWARFGPRVGRVPQSSRPG